MAGACAELSTCSRLLSMLRRVRFLLVMSVQAQCAAACTRVSVRAVQKPEAVWDI